MNHYAAVLILSGWVGICWGQEVSTDSSTVFSMHEVVITATRSQIPLRDSPSEVDVINRQTIELASGSTVADMMKLSGGVFLKEYGANAALKTLSLRGSASEHVLVLVNGNRYNNFQNNLVDLSLLPLDGVERIEIVHGGSSALYGADALGGVVNIITRRAGMDARLRTEVSGGSFGFERYFVAAQGKAGNLGLNAGYGSERGRDDFTYSSSDIPPVQSARRNSDFVRRQFYLNGDDQLDDRSSVTVSVQNVVADRGAPGPVGLFESDLARENDHDMNILANYSNAHIDRLNISLRSGVHYSYETFVDPNPAYPLNSFYKNIYANLSPQVQYIVSSSQNFIGGIDLGEGTLDGNDFDSKITRVQKAVYLSSETHIDFERALLDRLSFFGTLRYDHVTDVDHAFTPKFGVNIRLFQPGDVRVRASAGRNFRSPTFNDLYYRGFSNPNLKPEFSTSLDAGIMTSVVTHDLESDFEASYFYLDTKDRIFFDSKTYLPENIGRAESKGWELKWTGRMLDPLLTAAAHYTSTVAIKKNPTVDNDPTVGNQLPYVPKELFNISLSAVVEPVALTLVHSIVSSRFTDEANVGELPPYRLTNAVIAIRKAIGSWKLSAKSEFNNIFDEKYEVFKDYPMPGSNYRVTLGVEYTP